MRKFLQLFFVLSMALLLLPAMVQGQERTVTGTVLSEDNKTPLAGVTVKVKGTSRIVQTDANGKFSIRMSAKETLQVSYVGYETTELKPGSGDTVGVTLKTAANTMTEVVVTAMDQRRNPRELGYSVQKVSGDELKETQRENFMNGLQGRVAGLTVTPTSGMAGASTSVVLRGFNSISLDNSPLYVIDGVIMDNQTVTENHGGGGAGTNMGLASAKENRTNDYTNRMADLNPNDIETITVLKGPEAAALYGSQAASGAIIITTKRGNSDGKLNINYDNSFRVSMYKRFPEEQHLFGTGTNGVPGGALASTSGSYFGPAYPAGTKFYDNVENFFENAFSQTHNLALDYGKKNYNLRFSGSLLDQKSPIPTNSLKRYTARISGSVKLLKNLEVVPSVTFTRSENDKPLRGLNGYLLTLMVWPANLDVRDWQNPDESKKTIFNANPNLELDNPLFNVHNNRSHDETNRIASTLGVNYTPWSWLTLSARFGYDTYKTDGSIVNHPTSFYLTRFQGGSLDNYYRNYSGYNHTITATYKKDLGKNTTLRVLAGQAWQDQETEMYAVFGTNIIDSVGLDGKLYKGGSVVSQAGWETLLGGESPDSSITRTTTRTRLLNAVRNGDYNRTFYRNAAYFGEVMVGWKNFIFLTYSHRWEESSIFPKEFRKYNFPAGSLSFMLSDMFPGIKKGGYVNYLKLRGSLANTAKASAPYANQSIFGQNLGSGGGFAYGFNNGNPNLKPERQKTFEIGTEWRLFRNKLNFDVTYYKTKNSDLIGELVRFSYGTGFVLNTINIGSIENSGIEIALETTPIKNTNFSWTTRLNFNRMRNKVLTLPPNVSEYYNSDTWLYGNARGGLILGGPTTTITGLYYLRNNAGQILIDPATGIPINAATSAAFKILGDRNPNFTTGWLNTMSYKKFRLTFLWDLKVGGDVINLTDRYLTLQGRSTRSADRMSARIVPGVLRDGRENTANPTVNTIAVVPYFQQTYYTNMPEEAFVEKDVNWFRLRDITLSYNFSSSFLGSNLKFLKSLGVFLNATDLILLTNYSGADPAVNANTTATKGVGGLGFDYGNVGAPVNINFGFKASF